MYRLIRQCCNPLPLNHHQNMAFMLASTLKNEIMTMLEGMEDESVLRVVHKILGQNKAVYRLNDEQISAVREADEQYARGEAISDDEAEREVREWLKD